MHLACRASARNAGKPEQICVLGGGFGGLYAALRLQKMPWRGQRPVVTLVDKRDKFTFLPLLYEFASESYIAGRQARQKAVSSSTS